MKEIKDIVRAFDSARLQDKQTALATVVMVEGSSYRRPGARMLITEDGCITGAISGGCLEGDVLRKAQLAMLEQRNILVTYDTTDDTDNQLGIQLGCNGIVHILIEPINHASGTNPIELLRLIIVERENAVLATLFCLHDHSHQHPGTCLLMIDGNKVISRNISSSNQLAADAKTVLINGSSAFTAYNDRNIQHTALIDFIKPAFSLVLIGAGNDIIPVGQIANTLGWEVTVIDGRPKYATQERFPNARTLVCKPQQITAAINIDSNTVFALMTHNYNYDLLALGKLINTSTPYIGVLGPQKKLQRMLDDMATQGMVLTEAQMRKIHGPVGLDIGAETAEEIAVSVIAEIKSVLSKKNGKSLKNKKLAIHA